MTGVVGIAGIEQGLEEGELVKKFTLAPDRPDEAREAREDAFPPCKKKSSVLRWIAEDGFSLVLKKPTKALQDAIGLGRTRQRWVAKVSKVRSERKLEKRKIEEEAAGRQNSTNGQILKPLKELKLCSPFRTFAPPSGVVNNAKRKREKANVEK